MQYKNRTEDILYQQMLIANEIEVSTTSLSIMNLIQSLKVHNQLLGLACVFICLLETYKLSYSDVLGIAHNIVNAQSNNNADKNFKAIRQFMKNEWEILT